MQNLRNDVDLINQDFAKMRGLLEESLKLLEGTPDYGLLTEWTSSLHGAHANFNQHIGPAIDFLEQEQKDVEASIAEAQSELADLEKNVAEKLAEASKPIPTPPPPPPPLVPGEGDPRHGFTLGEELLGLIGIGAKAGTAPTASSSVWQVDSGDWQVDLGSRGPQQQAPPPKSPPKTPPKPRDSGESIGGSSWDPRE